VLDEINHLQFLDFLVAGGGTPYNAVNCGAGQIRSDIGGDNGPTQCQFILTEVNTHLDASRTRNEVILQKLDDARSEPRDETFELRYCGRRPLSQNNNNNNNNNN